MVDVINGNIFATQLTPLSHNDFSYPYCAAASCHTYQSLYEIYGSTPSSRQGMLPRAQTPFGREAISGRRAFLQLKQIKDGIMAPPRKEWVCFMYML